MPKIIKTAQSASYIDGDPYEMILNVAKAMSAAVGSPYLKVDKTVDATKDIHYYIPMKNIGYPGWCVDIRSYKGNNDNFSASIYLFDDQNNSVIDSDSYSIKTATVSSSYFICEDGKYPETCVVFKDTNNDTVVIDVHNGSTEDGSDLTASADQRFNLSVFFARDVNDEVLCGIGGGHIGSIRTKDANMVINNDETVPQSNKMASILHLTKMVNYLSPTYTEMKSAYVSVCRPIYTSSDSNRNRFTESLYMSEKRWGRSGVRDNSGYGQLNSYSAFTPYPPIEPYVAY